MRKEEIKELGYQYMGEDAQGKEIFIPVMKTHNTEVRESGIKEICAMLITLSLCICFTSWVVGNVIVSANNRTQPRNTIAPANYQYEHE